MRSILSYITINAGIAANKNCMMPQIFQVLRCYKCLVFQVHQTKKSNKWECKLCGEKQSVKRHYGQGTAKDCRLHVQKLNGMRGEIDELKSNQDDEEDLENEHLSPVIPKTYSKVTDSTWSNYVEPSEINEPLEEKTNDDGMTLGEAEVVLELPKKRKKFNKPSFKKNITVRPSLQEVHTSNNNDCDIAYTVYNGRQHINATEIQSSYTDHISENLVVKEELKHIDKSITKKKFIPPVINKNSKWAQFTDNAQEISEENEELEITPSASTTQNDLMFSLCDDDDWDNILNI